MIKKSEIMKIDGNMTSHLIRFRVSKFDSFRISLMKNSFLTTADYPIIEVSSDKVEFGKHLKSGVFRSQKSVRKKFPNYNSFDMYVRGDGVNLEFGQYFNGRFLPIGDHDYAILPHITFVGFSSLRSLNWIVEDAVSGSRMFFENKYYLNFTASCIKKKNEFFSVWDLQVEANPNYPFHYYRYFRRIVKL